MLMEIDPLPMRGSMVTISPSRRDVSPAEQLRRSPRLVPPMFRLVAAVFCPESYLLIFQGERLHIAEDGHRRPARGPTRQGGRARPLPRGSPGRPPVPIFCYMKSFALEKNQKEAFGTKRRRLDAEPGETNLGLRRSCSAGETSLREGEIIAIDPLIERGSISINIFTSTVSSQSLVHFLYSILVPKPQRYLWVASSVDYSL